MKSNTLTVLAFLAAIAAFAILPVNATAAAISFTVAGVLSILMADYGRSIEPVTVAAEVLPFSPGRRTPAGLGRAA